MLRSQGCSNPILHPAHIGGNSMLNIIWHARFKDNSFVLQYDKGGKEHLFKEVLDRQDELGYFALHNTINGDSFVVDMQNGCICKIKEGNEIFKPREDMLRKQEYDYRLIYFREVERTFDQKLNETAGVKITYFLGFQYTDENNKNHKRIIKINENGDWVVN